MITTSPETKLDQLAHDSASEEGAGGFMNPKKKRGRPKKVSAEGSPQPEPIRQNINDPLLQAQARMDANKQFLGGCMDFLDEALYPLHETPAARLQPLQRTMIVDNGAICMEQYMPGAIGKHMPLILMTFGLGGYGFGIYNARKIKLLEMQLRAQQMNGVARQSDIKREPISGAPIEH